MTIVTGRGPHVQRGVDAALGRAIRRLRRQRGLALVQVAGHHPALP